MIVQVTYINKGNKPVNAYNASSVRMNATAIYIETDEGVVIVQADTVLDVTVV